MDSVDLQRLTRFANASRRALETLASRPHSVFRDFPLAACGPAAELIGRLLKERFELDGSYVCGGEHPNLPRSQTHAWFESGGFIIDITHDQFSDTGVVGWVLPMDCGWHAAFGEVKRRKGYCMPSGWPMYPHDGYSAMAAALEADDTAT